MGVQRTLWWSFATALLLTLSATGCKETITRPIKNAVSLEFKECLGAAPGAVDAEAHSGEANACRDNIDKAASTNGEANACLLLRAQDHPEKVFRVSLKWADGQPVPVNDPSIDIPPGQQVEATFFILSDAGPSSICDALAFDQACGEGCVLRLTQPGVVLQKEGTLFNFKQGGRCTTEWSPRALPPEICNGVDDNCDGLVDDEEQGVYCGENCATNDDCADEPGKVCDPNKRIGSAPGRCVLCNEETHEGCGADELCCGSGDALRCVPTSPDECTACNSPEKNEGRCDGTSDRCVDRTCVCGETGEACGEELPVCKDGACQRCENHDQCGADALCCNGSCVPTSLENCTDCYEGCGINDANRCVGRQCVCGTNGSCTSEVGEDSTALPFCLPASASNPAPASYRCQECRESNDCAGQPGKSVCFLNACEQCDPFTQEGCAHTPATPICHQPNPTTAPTCVGCGNSGDCEGRPDGLVHCLAGNCVACEVGSNSGCDGDTPICDGGSCRECTEDSECPGALLCHGGQCVPCKSETNEGCGGDTPICFGDQLCQPCDSALDDNGAVIGDLTCANTDPQLICATSGRCERCDVSDHRQCADDELCCGAPGRASCQPTGFDRANGGAGCASCGSFCSDPVDPADPNGLRISDLSNQCVDRQCVCGDSGALCDASNLKLCTPGDTGGECVLCRSNADCGMDAQCCNGTCVGTGFGPGTICTSCDLVEGACTAPTGSKCTDRQCLCETSAECGGDKPICDTSSGGCFECLAHDDCDGHASGPYCHDRKCSPCDPNGVIDGTGDHYGCAEESPTPICATAPEGSALGAQCGACQTNNDCSDRPGDLNYCHNGQCVLCEPNAASHVDPGCAPHTTPVCDVADGRRSCRACGDDSECPGDSVCVTSGADEGSCKGCDPQNPVACGGQAPICDADTLICRGCQQDNECGPGSICTPSDGRCVACEVGTHRGCGLDALCCGNAPNQACVPLSMANCLGCGQACNSDISNHCADRANANALQGTCECGASGSACVGVNAYCDGLAPGGICVGCRDNNDCPPFSGVPYCVPLSTGPVNGGQPGYCRACDPDVDRLSDQSGCDLLNDLPFCKRDANEVAACTRCANDAECTGHTIGNYCVSTGACKSCNPDRGKNNAGCNLTGNKPVCSSSTFSCRGCESDLECAETHGNGNLCHEGTGTCFSCTDTVKNGTETGIDCGGPDCPNSCGNGQGCVNASDCTSGVCTSRTCRAPTCADGVKNGDETGIDCGGVACRAAGKLCEDSSACRADGDCQSGLCVNQICQVPTCADGVKNGAETDTDCGGLDCRQIGKLCGDTKQCALDQDCQSLHCDNGQCKAATCADGILNGAETDTDCGGAQCRAANKLCDVNQSCGSAADCITGVCQDGQCKAATCTDGVKNGNETARDCGGVQCRTQGYLCTNNQACVLAGDCQSGVCTGPANQKTCKAPTCTDNVKNGSETDKDCGGGTCGLCADGKSCSSGLRDCASGVCVDGTCQAPACNDGVKNGDEVGIDCGGSCGLCPDGRTCGGNADCASNRCVAGVCGEAQCDDGAKNGGETDIDCGGAACAPCADGKTCLIGSTDCLSLNCVNGHCAAASCLDGIKNGDETGLDCGGPDCQPCADGLACGQPTDCMSGVCQGQVCQVPTCSDQVKNGAETDKDCGGPCAPCDVNRACGQSSDCKSLVCTGNVCQLPTCTDGVRNGSETDVDCGGPDCLPCLENKSCELPSDCESGVCTEGSCQPPSCEDGVKNGLETGIDCGQASNCGLCVAGLGCADEGDCESGVCADQGGQLICQAPTCQDSLKNGVETDVDCGGVTCRAANKLCNDGQQCALDGDCAHGFCNDGICGGCAPQGHNGCGAQDLCCPDAQNAQIFHCEETGVTGEAGCGACGQDCNPNQADRCENRQCMCGANAACANALFCVADGNGQASCVQCRDSEDCNGAEGVCVAGSCAVCDSADNTGCDAPTSVCRENAACVQCLTNEDCPGDDVCDPNGFVCKAE